MASLYEYYDTGADTNSALGVGNQLGQTFTPSIAHSAYSFKALLFRVGSPGVVTCSYYATSVGGVTDGLPTGGVLSSGTLNGNDFTDNSAGIFYEFIMPTAPNLSNNTKYAAVIKAPNGIWATNIVRWLADETLPAYSGGSSLDSSDGGVSWNGVNGKDFLFEDWGNPISSASAGNGINFGINF